MKGGVELSQSSRRGLRSKHHQGKSELLENPVQYQPGSMGMFRARLSTGCEALSDGNLQPFKDAFLTLHHVKTAVLCCAQHVSAHHFSKCANVSTAALHCARGSLEPGEGEEILLLPDEIKREGKEEKMHPGKVWSSRLFLGGVERQMGSRVKMKWHSQERRWHCCCRRHCYKQILLFLPQKQGFYEPSADALR